MQPTTKKRLLLFSVKRSTERRKFALYFVRTKALTDPRPKIYQYFCKNAREFSKFRPGREYTLNLKENRIISFEVTDEIVLTDDEFYNMCDIRDRIELPKHIVDSIGMNAEDYHPSGIYYTFENYKMLCNYKASVAHKTAFRLMRCFFSIIAAILPISLYLLYVFSMLTNNPPDTQSFLSSLGPTICTLGALPFTIWLICCLYSLSELILLNIPAFRYDVLNIYALEWGGIRKSVYMKRGAFRPVILKGSLLFGIAVLSLLITYIIY